MCSQVHFYDLATAAIEKTANNEGPKLTLNVIKQRLKQLIYEITAQKFIEPTEGEEVVVGKLKALKESLTSAFAALEDEYR